MAPGLYLYLSSSLLECWVEKKLSNCYSIIKSPHELDPVIAWVCYAMFVDKKKLSDSQLEFVIDLRNKGISSNWLIMLNGDSCDFLHNDKIFFARNQKEVSKFLLKLYCNNYPSNLKP